MSIRAEQISDAIWVYHNTLSDELCDGIWDFYYSNIDRATEGKTSGGFYPDTKKTLDFAQTADTFSEEQRQVYNEFDKKIYESMKVAVSMYVEKYDWIQRCPNMIDTGYLWQGYKKGEGYYKEHIDGECWSPHVADRILAIVAYVNTLEEGGETYFRHQDVSVKPIKGSVAIFPTHWSYPHQAMVPMSSDKLILSSFVVYPDYHNHHD